MDRQQLSAWRSDVISSFIAVEQLLNCIVSQHYFQKIHKGFFLEVLYDVVYALGRELRLGHRGFHSKGPDEVTALLAAVVGQPRNGQCCRIQPHLDPSG